MINKHMIGTKCSICSKVEIQDHVIKYQKTREIRRTFIKELTAELIKVKPNDIEIDKILEFVEDILRYFEDNNEDEYKTNQVMIGMAKLFRRHIVKVWKGINFGLEKYKILNQVAVKISVQYYQKCWVNRNKAYHNLEVQWKQIKK